MLKVRAVYLSEDFQPYGRLPVAREHGPLQAPGHRCIASRHSRDTPSTARGHLDMFVNTEMNHETRS